MIKTLPFTIRLLFLLITFIKSENVFIHITSQSDPNHSKKIGPNRIISFETDRSNLKDALNPLEMENLTHFQGRFSDIEGNKYIWNCNLYDSEDKNVEIKCKVDDTILDTSYSKFKFEFGSIKYGDNYIYISSDNYYFNVEKESYGIQNNNKNRNLLLENQEITITNDIIINITENNDTIYIGNKGIIYFRTDYNDKDNIFNSSDIEEKTKFNTTIIDKDNNGYNVNCRLWKVLDEIIIICSLEKNLKKGNNSVKIINKDFWYNNINVRIKSNSEMVTVIQCENNIPFIYSDKQFINMNNNSDIYELKFKYDSYYNDLLYIVGSESNYLVLDNCNSDENKKELICIIQKEKIQEILIYQDESFSLGTINDNIGLLPFGLVYNIYIKDEIDEREEIYIDITDLLVDITELGSTYAYKTNISSSSINNIRSGRILDLAPDENEYFYFKKTTDTDLLLIGVPNYNTQYFQIGPISVKNFAHHHYKYIFRPSSKNEQKVYFNTDIKGIILNKVYPETLNFYKSNEVTIRYLYTNIYDSMPDFNISLNSSNNSNLECRDLLNMKKCVVNSSQFDSKENKYYLTYHSNHKGSYSINYEVNPIQAIFTKEIEIELKNEYNTNTIYIGQKGTIYNNKLYRFGKFI